MTVLEQAKPVVDFVNDHDEFVVVSHYDADGLTACAIACHALHRAGKKYSFIPTKQLDEQRIQKIIGMGDHYLFVDFGSGQIPTIEKHLKSFAICDHHETIQQTDHPHLNAHLVGLDGANEVSGAGMTYVFAKALNPKNVDLAHLAIVGAVGDMQESIGAFIGFNRIILEDAVSAGKMEYKQDIRLFGRHSRPLVQFLTYSSDPIFPGLTANEAGCVAFLKELNLPTDCFYVDLSEEEKKKLISALFVLGTRENIPDHILKGLVGEVYELKEEKDKTFVKDAKDFATLLNACGRHEQGEIGVHVAMGDRAEYYKKAENLLQAHRRFLRDGITFAQEHGAKEYDNCSVLDAGTNIKETLVGVVAGMLYGAQAVPQDKPILAFALDDEGHLKISARATWNLVRSGLNLGKALREACEVTGGEGGGHNIAAGARIPPDKKEEFIAVFDGIVAKQLNRA